MLYFFINFLHSQVFKNRPLQINTSLNRLKRQKENLKATIANLKSIPPLQNKKGEDCQKPSPFYTGNITCF
jgi:hypothetical protein